MNLPYILVRKRRPPLRYASLEEAKRPHDSLRFNAGTDVDAAIFGPKGEAWYCGRFREDRWIRDDDRRKREAQSAESAA